MPAPTIEQLQDRRVLSSRLRELSTVSHAAEEVRGTERRVREELERHLQAHPSPWGGSDARIGTQKTWHAFQPLAVWLLDVTLLYYLLDFYVRGLTEGLRYTCRYLIPAVVVYLEVCFASRAAQARDRGDESEARYWRWAAWIWALAVASGVAVVVWFQNEEFPQVARVLLTLTLGGLTLGAHLTLAKGGDHALDGIAYWQFSSRRRMLERRATRLEQEASRSERAAADRFQQYMASLQPGMQAGPFDRVTQDVLHRAYGYAVIQPPNGNPGTPNGNGHSPAPAVPPAAAPSPANGDGEVTYLREILERHVRDEEGEVRP